ncbi:MAG: class I SAM-dependent methyltransferase [Acidobacteria bacterium]|nr:class I SAM-dependent methyltransferase [Acidobacteriota bacterium]
MDPTLRFSNRAENYVKYRPRYPQDVIETLRLECELSSSSLIADIGSGTGALTELFLQNGNPVFAVEPNRAMRDAAERLLGEYPGFRSIAGRAEDTSLPDHSVDFIVVGQAFHWFHVRDARLEFLRILRLPGWAMVVWNEREFQTTPFLIAYDQLLQRYAPEYARERHKSIYDSALDDFFGPGGFTEKTFSCHQQLDFAGVKGRMLSSSYTPEPDHPNHEPMMAELSKIYKAHQVNDRVTFDYITRLYYGRLRN